MNKSIFKPHFETAEPPVRLRLEAIAQEVAKRVPQAEPCISYRMPAFRLGKVFFYFAGFKNHIGVYPPAVGPAQLMEALKPFRGPKGNLILPHSQELPLALIGQAAEHMAVKFGKR